MKIILVVCGLILAGAAGWFFFARSGADHYGNAFKGLPAADVGQMADKPADFLKKEVRIEGTVGRQCPSKGCWFYVKNPAGKEIKVEMGDTVPTLPARAGKAVTVEGQLIQYGKDYEFIGTAVEFH